MCRAARNHEKHKKCHDENFPQKTDQKSKN